MDINDRIFLWNHLKQHGLEYLKFHNGSDAFFSSLPSFFTIKNA